MSHSITIADLRAEMDLTLAEFGQLIGLSKSQMHEVERTGRASLRVALALEQLSSRRIDAARLNDDVRQAREGVVSDHADPFTDPAPAPATGQNGELSGGVAL